MGHGGAAAGPCGAGWFAFGGLGGDFGHLVEGALPEVGHHAGDFNWGIAISSTVIALAGIGLAWAMYERRWVSSASVRQAALPVATLLENKYFLDWLYERVFAVRVFQEGWNRLVELFDTYVVDAIVNGSGAMTARASGMLRVVQTGQAQFYAFVLGAGAVVIILAVYTANPL